MIIANFSMAESQIKILITFRCNQDTRTADHHPFMDVDHNVGHLKRLCREGYLLWHDGCLKEGRVPGYTLTPKGEMMLRMIELELRRTLEFFEGMPQPKSDISGSEMDVASGKTRKKQSA